MEKLRIGVFSSDFIKSKSQTLKLTEGKNIIKRINTLNKFEIETEKAIYTTYRINQSVRGKRNHYIYIDKKDACLKNDLVISIVVPTFITDDKLNKSLHEELLEDNRILFF